MGEFSSDMERSWQKDGDKKARGSEWWEIPVEEQPIENHKRRMRKIKAASITGAVCGGVMILASALGGRANGTAVREYLEGTRYLEDHKSLIEAQQMLRDMPYTGETIRIKGLQMPVESLDQIRDFSRVEEELRIRLVNKLELKIRQIENLPEYKIESARYNALLSRQLWFGDGALTGFGMSFFSGLGYLLGLGLSKSKETKEITRVYELREKDYDAIRFRVKRKKK